MRLAALIASAALGAPVVAEPLPPSCMWDSAAQRLLAPDATGGAIQSVFPFPLENDFVTWTGNGTSGTSAGGQIVVQHCPTDNYLLVAMPKDTAAADRVSDQFEALVLGEGSYTLRQIGEALATLGAGARVGQGNIGRCGCDVLGLGR